MIDIAFHSYFKYLALGASLAIKKGFAGPYLHSESFAHSLNIIKNIYSCLTNMRLSRIPIGLGCFAELHTIKVMPITVFYYDSV